jgi:hypothetical protein
MKWLLVAITVVATALSDLLQSYELKRAGEQSVSARGIARLAATVARRRYLILSIVCLAFSFFAFMALVQSQPLSFAVPASRGQLHPGDDCRQARAAGTGRAAARGRHAAGAGRHHASGTVSSPRKMSLCRP